MSTLERVRQVVATTLRVPLEKVQPGALLYQLAELDSLTLAEIAAALDPRAANVHFQDHLENGRIAFDYRLHPGVVRKSNALDLMRSVGLDV